MIKHITSITGDNKYLPPTRDSINWKNWLNTPYVFACQECKLNHGKIFPIYSTPAPKPPIHNNCRCRIKKLRATNAGQGTQNGKNGADWYLKHLKKLPDYYVTYNQLAQAGWKKGKTPDQYFPNTMLTAGIYENYEKRLAHKDGRIWREADINYVNGKRNECRIVWSNDGLIFVTYDHYLTFIEII